MPDRFYTSTMRRFWEVPHDLGIRLRGNGAYSVAVRSRTVKSGAPSRIQRLRKFCIV